MTDYLVKGCSGFIGSKIIEQLKLNQVSFIGIDKFTKEPNDFIQFNLTDRYKTLRVLDDNNPKTIIHCCTYSAGRYKVS